MQEQHTLYAIGHSLFSGRARSYLVKNAIPFRELSTGHESFKADVLPKGKLPTIPTLLTSSGQVIRDGAEIIEHFEAHNGYANRPAGPRQQIVSALFDAIGCDGLLRPAMHYRWNYPEQNLSFVHYHFYHSQRDLPQREDKTEHMMNRMRNVAQIWGVNEGSIELVESLYMDYLAALNAHFEQQAYLLGWRPCIGDFGLLAPMFAHLGRDPYPAALMQQHAPRVYRWVERMNRPNQDAPEYFNAGTDFLESDEVPETLLAVLKILAEDFAPETVAAAASLNAWLDENKPAANSKADRMLGSTTFAVRGQQIEAAAQPYRFYLLQRVQAIYDALNASEKTSVDTMLASCGMSDVIASRLNRTLAFEDNLEVWR